MSVAARPPAPAHAVVLFDGGCNLCNGFVQFVILRDPAGYFRFAALQSPAAARVMKDAGVVTPAGADSVVLVTGGRAFTRSAAALRIVRRLEWPWPLAFGLIAIPRPIRDRIYDLIARNRVRWFGQRDTCLFPGAGLRERFLD
jgi:predicted DCC family thiol-disulfide oxidoreductase YuxK